MMYHVSPTRLKWTVIGHISPQKIIEMGGNLEAIDDWQLSDRPPFDSDFELALRYGIPVSDGIVIDADYILVKERPRELREVAQKARRSQQHPQIQATEEFIDKYLIPGWKEHGEDLNRKIDEQSARSIREAEEDAQRQLEEPLKEELIAHWHSLGGHVPN